ncbi:LppP/LprE family lipoprotein [Nocardia sp. NBC_01503]|uniref:LppP/LprE family lipoprotein n=1 Tax=Nocardia sp. NBC_01503 TaxID=2975997 RepID=UPI002E7BE701|nr:LppP/LprE family lipoprotein [Nocardia sp. NBC_01503]WTL29852.1 LppP/LprE family lipoprotein [Nocardia sp. NBC_01503]
MRRMIGIIAAVAAVTLVTACQDDGTTPAPGGSSASSSVTVAPPGSAQPSATQPTPQSPGTTQPTGNDAPATAGNGRCVDLNSPVVTAALGRLGPNVGGDGFYADSGTEAAVGSCPTLLWVLAGTPRGTASSPWQVMLFNHAGYLGTATKNWTAYTTVVGSSDRSVQIQYRWLAGQDASCCPSGGPVVVTLTLGSDNHTVTPDRDFPTQATDPNSGTAPPVCPVSKSVLLAALKGTDIESRLAKPIELEDQIDCSGDWAMAHSGTHDNTVNRAQVLFHYVAADGGWKPVDLGSALRCTEIGVPSDIATKICH